jgi:hypothetical protein
VQNRLNLTNGNWRDMLTECQSHEKTISQRPRSNSTKTR